MFKIIFTVAIFFFCVHIQPACASSNESSRNVDSRDTVFGLLRSLTTELKGVKNIVVGLAKEVNELKNSSETTKDEVLAVKAGVVKMKIYIETIKQKQETIKNQQDSIGKDVTYIKGSPGIYPAKFVGVGYRSHYDDYKQFDNVATVGDCLSVCYNYRVREGALWNGVQYYVQAKHCWCIKHDTGHQDNAGTLHYRFL